ncbi:nuclear transport factor 2 family protein [Aeromicrobium sp.]|uniref:nuclear transport factor 2 family protein n=1 Tax=Aeromicrobium sp. TaxID=1871063 RepID=UPI002FCAF8FB
MDDPLEAVVETYLTALREADLERVLSLFAPDAVVHSPLYGVMAPAEFYPALFADTSEANLQLRSVMHGRDIDGVRTMSFWFHFDWRLPSGAAAPFDVVDLVTLDEDGRFTSLHIIYDTVDVRPAFEAETGRPSWRQ